MVGGVREKEQGGGEELRERSREGQNEGEIWRNIQTHADMADKQPDLKSKNYQ